MEASLWYKQLKKPSWAPHSWIYSPVWAVLYSLMIFSFGYTFLMFYKDEVTFIIVVPFILNLFFNLIFTTVQFGLKNNILATIDILLVLGTIIWLMIVIYPIAPWIMYLQIPYLGWILFASVLQVTITAMNLKKSA